MYKIAPKVVDYLRYHPWVERVNHPSLTTAGRKNCTIDIIPTERHRYLRLSWKGTEEQARKFTESLRLFSLLANVADVKSLVIHPASTTHSQLSAQELQKAGIKPNSALSIGTEHIEDILADLDQGFAAI